jgi:hypothetical protein
VLKHCAHSAETLALRRRISALVRLARGTRLRKVGANVGPAPRDHVSCKRYNCLAVFRFAI